MKVWGPRRKASKMNLDLIIFSKQTVDLTMVSYTNPSKVWGPRCKVFKMILDLTMFGYTSEILYFMQNGYKLEILFHNSDT